jgi:hypothetical protein
MDKEVAKIIREQRRKDKEETNKRRITNSQSVVDRTIQRLVEK